MFSKDERTPEQRQRDSEMTEAAGRMILGVLFLLVLPFLTLSAVIGYVGLSAYREKKTLGVAVVALIAGASVFYLVGPLQSVRVAQFLNWGGALFTDFNDYFYSFYREIYSFCHFNINKKTYLDFITIIRFGMYLTLPGATGFAWYIHKKNFEEKTFLYSLIKAPLALWLRAVSNPKYTLYKKFIVFTLQWGTLVLLWRFLLPHLPGDFWTLHFGQLFLSIGGITGFGTLLSQWMTTPKEERKDVIEISKDGTSLSPQILNHHVHVLGESGFGKTVFLTRLIEHHVKHGMGLIFIDLKADTEMVSEVVGFCARYSRTQDLKIFDCSRPDLSSPYNVLLHGNPTEIKDKLVGSFSWENEYYKNAAQSFLLSLMRGLVYLRDKYSTAFTLDDLYQATLSPDALVALQGELDKKGAPENLREDINELAHYLRSRENFKELHGLRTQIKLLIDSEFGPLLTATTTGIDIFNDIRDHKIVYVLLDSQRYGESAKKLGKLILQDLKSASAKIISEIPREKRTQCSIIVDEFADLATEQFVGLINRARGSGLGIVIAHQEMSDLEAFSPTMRDQVMGSTATTISFLQKMPESAEILAQIAGTKRTVKTTKQVKEETFFISMKNYTGIESEREVEEFIIHPNTFKNLRVGECVIIGKYPRPWNKKVLISKVETTPIDALTVSETLREIRSHESGTTMKALNLRALVKVQYAKPDRNAPPEDRPLPPPTVAVPPAADPNF